MSPFLLQVLCTPAGTTNSLPGVPIGAAGQMNFFICADGFMC
jgi:hypothetical protein